MDYLMIANFWKFQNADVWKKSRTHPPWFKHFVHHDRELDKLPVTARLLFVELLKSATRHSNVLEHEMNWLCGETRMTSEQIAESLPLLLKGGWLSETKSPRRSREPSRKNLDSPRDLDVDVDVEKEGFKKTPNGASGGAMFALRTMLANGAIVDEVALEAEFRSGDFNLSEYEQAQLAAELKKRRVA